MKNRWLVRLYIFLLVGITTGLLAACGSTGEVESSPTTTPTESAQMMEDKQSTPIAEMVDEVPTEEMMPTETPMLQAQPTPTGTTQPTDTPTVELEPTAAIEPPNTPFPEAELTEESPTVLRQGQFTDADQSHTGSGTATLYQEPDGSYRLSFENFAVCCGPDLRVLLADNPAPTGMLIWAIIWKSVRFKPLTATRNTKSPPAPMCHKSTVW